MSDPPRGLGHRPRDRDVDWDTWPVQAYLAENYRELHPCEPYRRGGVRRRQLTCLTDQLREGPDES
jgi:hypothetical protein